MLAELSSSDSRALDWGSNGSLFEPHPQQSHCVLSLSKDLYSLLSTGSIQKGTSQNDC